MLTRSALAFIPTNTPTYSNPKIPISSAINLAATSADIAITERRSISKQRSLVPLRLTGSK